MGQGVINGFDFGESEVMKYYAPPSTWSDEKKRDNVRTKIFSADWTGGEKKDGFFARLIVDDDGNITLTPRNRNTKGEFPNKIEWVPQIMPFVNSLPRGTCLLGELYFPSNPGSKNVQTIMGCLKEKALSRQDAGEKIHFYIFDCLAYNGTLTKDLGFARRAEYVDEIEQLHSGFTPYVQFANYYWTDDLWRRLQEILADGGEGMVLMHKDGVYEPGKRPSKTTLKVKKELAQTIDCFFTGYSTPPTKLYTGKEIESWPYWFNEASETYAKGLYFKDYQAGAPIIPVTKGFFNHWCGSMEIGVLRHKEGANCTINDQIYENCEVVGIGLLSGVTEEMKANPIAFAFKPIEVSAMELDNESGALRHGKMKNWRPDLTIADCTWEKIFG